MDMDIIHVLYIVGMHVYCIIIRFNGICIYSIAHFLPPFIFTLTQGVFERLSKVDDISSVGWVCVDQRPAKQALSSLVSKWKHIYASHLERQVHL